MSLEQDRRALVADRRSLVALIRETSVRRQRVTLASGRESDLYLDLRQALMRPRGVELAGRLALDRLRQGTPVEAVGGMAVGAVPFVAAILAAAAHDPDAPPLVGFFVRKETKRHGLAKRIEGAFAAGQTVALVEDTTTTGGSTLEAVDAVLEAGAKVGRVICLVDRGEGAVEAFAERGLELEPVFSLDELQID